MILSKRPKILLVEDNSDDIELIKLSLTSQINIYDLDIVRDGQEALDYLSNSVNPLPDLVLLDLLMPKVSGHEVLKALRTHPRTKNLPVIIFTSSKDQDALTLSYRHGANAHIEKAMRPEEFKAALQNLDVYWIMKTK